MSLPRFIFLKSELNNKFLRYRKEDDSSHAFLQFTQDESDEHVEIQYIKFEVEMAETEGLVHIRSCYNNKYWVRKSAENNTIVAEGNEAEEDQSKISCTLFKPVLVDPAGDNVSPDDEPRKFRFIHIDQLGQHYTRVSKFNLLVGDQDSETDSLDVYDAFTVYNANASVILPEYIALMGHNNQYCAVTRSGAINYLRFSTTDIGTEGTSNQAINLGTITTTRFRFQNTSFQGNWTVNSPHVVVASGNGTGFTPIVLGGNRIALRSDHDMRFVGFGSGLGLQSLMGIGFQSIEESAIFRVVEPVFLREIDNVNFNLDDSRIYNMKTVEKFRDTRENRTSVTQTGSFRVMYTESNTSMWNESSSVTTGLTATWSSSIPFVGMSLGVELSTERTESREWGVEIVQERQVDYVQELEIPPFSKVTLTVLATQAFCNVPFTCDVHDTMTDGNPRSYTKTDGLFQGANELNFSTQIIPGDV